MHFQMEWSAAKNDCRAKGMKLVSIETLEESEAIKSAISTQNIARLIVKTDIFYCQML